MEIIDSLSADDKKKLMSRMAEPRSSLKKFKKDKIAAILSDFTATGLYEKEFLTDIEKGLKKSSVYPSLSI